MVMIRDSDWLFHPGEYIEDELEARGWTTHDIAIRATNDPKEQRIIELTCDLTIAVTYAEIGDSAGDCILGYSTAEALAKAFGTSVEIWLNIEAEYQRRRLAMKAN